MRPTKNTGVIGITLAAVAAGVPLAATGANFYGGAGMLGSELEPRVGNTPFVVTEKESTGGRLFAGIDISRRFSVEGYYADLGAATVSDQTVTGDINYKSHGIAGLVYLFSTRGADGLQNREGLMFYAKGGFGYLDNSSTGGVIFNQLNPEHLAAGVGLEYGFSSGIGIRAEFLNSDVDIRDLSINLLYRFGASNKKDSSPLNELLTDAVMNESIEEPVDMAQTDAGASSAEAEVTPEMIAEENDAEQISLDSDADGVADDADLCAGTAAGAQTDSNGCVFGVIDGINFNTGSVDLTVAATAALDGLISELKRNPGIRIAVQSHTDSRGDAGKNMQLSRQRAVSVVRYLADVGGIDLGRMVATGFGESQPLETNNNAEGRAVNRRVEIEIIQ